ncbi:karyopherin KAP120 PWA37_001064 [Arxiozyma heterogenica]|uniref:karyopherin KAP120 n=1 Tax=Arxiozyma heterogenica TaxID=278026 RepID=UPI002EFC0487
MFTTDADLTEQNIIQTLEQASNPQHAGSDVQKLAEHQLKVWETQPGFHYMLQSIYLDLSNPLQVRWLAVIQFKNGVDKYWRSSRINAIKKDEKATIRARLFDLIDEQNNQLCIQNAQATSKISRLDFPAEWPNLFEQLEALLKDDHVRKDHVKLYNILTHINQIIKILGTARIGRCKPAMQSKVPLIFPLIVRVYLQTFEEYTHKLQSNNGNMTNDGSNNLTKLQVSYLALKVLRRIVSEGYERPEKDESVCEFLKLSVTHLQSLISQQDVLGKYEVYEKFIKCYGKLYYTLVTEQPTTFISIPCSIEILITYTKLLFEKASVVYNENSDVSGDFWEHVAIRGFLLLKRVINFVKKKGVITLKARNDKQSIDMSIQKINFEFLNENLIKQLVDILVDCYLKLRPAELESWFCDPEEWMNEQMITSYEYQIRPCAENFFQDLINSFPDLLVPYLLNKIENEATTLTNSLEDFLKKDAIYASFQLSASAVSNMVDFDRLLVDVFLPEATNNATGLDQLKIIRRRVCLIINEWCTVKSSEKSKSLCYKFFSELLMSDDDKVVTLSAVQSLRTMVDDWNFDKDIFQPYLIDITTVLLRKVLPSVSLTETRLYVLNTLSDIIIQTKPLINQDLLVEILQIVPKLWDIANNNASESILSNALLRLIRHLVSSLGPKSYLTWDIALPILSLACDPSTSHYALLNEDGFDLWESLLQNYSSKECQLSEKFKDLLPFLEYVLIPNFYQAGILNALFDAIFKEDALSTYQCGQLLQIIARLTYVNPDAIIEYLSTYHSQLPTVQENMQLSAMSRKLVFKDYPLETLVEKFIEIWIFCFKDIYDPKIKKIHILGISSLLRTKLPIVFNNLDSIVSLWVEILEEINENNNGDCEKYHLNDVVTEQSIAFFPLTTEQFRQHELSKNNDPVHTISLKDFIQQTMVYVETYLGPSGYKELLSRLNPTLLENLQLFLSMRSSQS